MDALKLVVYLDDKTVEHITVQKFEFRGKWDFVNPTEQLLEATNTKPPVVYIYVQDSLDWRKVQ